MQMQQQMAAQQTQAMLIQQMMMAQQNNGGKKTRELYVGNLAIGMVTDQMLREFFNTALAGLSPEAANGPVVINVWMASDGKYSFVEFRTPELATTAIGLDKVELCGREIHVGRPSGYVPPVSLVAHRRTYLRGLIHDICRRVREEMEWAVCQEWVVWVVWVV